MRFSLNNRFTRNPYILFSSFIFYYAYIIVVSKWPSLYGDEIRYVDFAKNLLHGFYSPAAPHINLWNGPGYPIILMPFVALHVPMLYVTLMNAVYEYLAVVFLYKALSLGTTKKIAAICGLLLAIYPNAISMVAILYTEAFTMLLISSFLYAVTLFYKRSKNKYGIMAGLILGYLILTKIIFGYVIIVCLITCLTALLFKRNRFYYIRSVRILLIAFAVSIPYLVYTYHLTGKALYWGNSGGMSLYWMSTPYENEYGDWKVPELTNKQYPTLFKSAEGVAMLKKNHSKEMKFILAHNEVEQDELFKQAGINNIKSNPLKFIRNYVNNCSRMLFNFPYSYAYQDAAILGNIIIGSFILWSSIICAVITWFNRRKILFPIKLALLITAVYLLLSGALSSYPRQLNIIIPVLLFWAGFIVSNINAVNLRFADNEELEDISLASLAEIGVYTEDSVKDAGL